MEKIKQKNDWGVYGNSFQIDLLKKNIMSNDIAHAYLFTGPSKIGKKKTALSFIKSVVCENNKNGNFCSVCSTCKKIDSNSFPDLKMFEGTSLIKISEIREIISSLSLKAFNSPYKIVLIDDAERMNEESSNAILKTIEEPEGKTIIILITKNQKLMLPTIVSRSRIVKFSAAPQSQMEKIEKYLFGINSGLSYLCVGKIGKLLEIKKDNSLKEFIESAKKDIGQIMKSSIYDNLKLAENLYKEYEDTPEMFIERLNTWILIIRQVILKNYLNYVDLKDENAKISIPPEKGEEIIDFLIWTKNNLKNTRSGFNYKLIIDKLVLNISQAEK